MMETVKLFFDMEFTGLHQYSTPISIGIATENEDRAFYAEFNDYDESQVDAWLHDNVISKLRFKPPIEGEKEHRIEWYSPDHEEVSIEMRGSKKEIAEALILWIAQFTKDSNTVVEMWSDCPSYDWVLFCSLFEADGETHLPHGVFYIPFDIATLFKDKGYDPDISREDFAGANPAQQSNISKHNALWDAKVIARCYYRLTKVMAPNTFTKLEDVEAGTYFAIRSSTLSAGAISFRFDHAIIFSGKKPFLSYKIVSLVSGNSFEERIDNFKIGPKIY